MSGDICAEKSAKIPDSEMSKDKEEKGNKEKDECGWEHFKTMFKEDIKSRELWKLKILFLLHTAAMMSLFPFLTIHLKSLGVSVDETAYIYALIPVTAIFAPPVMGYFADRIGNFRIYLAVLGVIGGLIPLTFLAVPPARERVYLPSNLTANFECQNSMVVMTSLDMMCDSYDSVTNVTGDIGLCHLSCAHDTDLLSFQVKSPLLKTQEELSDAYFEKLGNSSSFGTTYKVLSGDGSNASLPCDSRGLLKYMLDKYKDQMVGKLDNMNEDVQKGFQSDNATCHLVCETTVSRKSFCKKGYYQQENNVVLTFWLMLVLRVFFGVLFAGYMILMEGAVMAIIKEQKRDLGLQRVWASIGAMAFAPISGLLMDYASQGKQKTDYRPAFILFAVLKCICAILVTRIDLSFKQSSTTVMADLKVILRNPHLIVFFFICLFCGINFGYIENFLFWWLEELGSGKSLMGLTVAVGTAAGIPWLVASGPIIARFGHEKVIILGLLAYTIRLLGYSLIVNPYACLPFEALECLTNSLMMTAFVTYASKLSTMSTIASVLGIMGAMYFGLGRGAGSLVGGLMMKRLGTRHTFRWFSFESLILAIIYILYYVFFIWKDGFLFRKAYSKATGRKEAPMWMKDIKSNKEEETVKKVQQQAIDMVKVAGSTSSVEKGHVNKGLKEEES